MSAFSLKKTIAGAFFITIMLSIAVPVFAQTGPDRSKYETLTPIPTTNPSEDINEVTTTNPVDYINTLYQIGISLAVVLAVFMIVLGGFETMSTDNVSKATEGRKRIQRAVWGIVLLVASYLILNTINPNLLNIGAIFNTVEKSGKIQSVEIKPSLCGQAPYNPQTQECVNGTVQNKTQPQ